MQLGLNQADVAIRFVACLVAVGQLIAGAQLIANRRLFEHSGLLAWRHVRRRYELSRLAPISALSFDAAAVIGVALLKCSGAAALVVCAVWRQPLLYPLVILVAANATLTIRIPYGHIGADDMGNVILAALLLAAVVDTPLVQSTCLTFIALESAAAYATAGLSKLTHVGWRDGSFVRELISTAGFGSARAAGYVTRSGLLSTSLGVAVVTYECLFPSILVAPYEWAIAGLAVGALFHAGVAVVMGLNTFVWAFTAAYPALLFVNSQVHRW